MKGRAMSNNGTPTASLTFTVDLDIDTEVWQMNYGLNDLTNIREDIRSQMQEVITELIEQHLDTTGNEGLVHVGYKV